MAHHVAVAVEDGGGDSAATDFGSAGGCHGRNRNDHGCHNRCQSLGLGTRLCPAATILAVAGELSAACCLSFSLPWFTSLHLCHRLPRCRLLPMSLEPSLAQLAPASRRHPTTAPSTEAAALDFLPVRSGVASPRFVIVELIPRRIRAPCCWGSSSSTDPGSTSLPRLLAVGDGFSRSGERQGNEEERAWWFGESRGEEEWDCSSGLPHRRRQVP